MPASNEIQAASSGLVENSFSGGSRNWLRPRLKQCICWRTGLSLTWADIVHSELWTRPSDGRAMATRCEWHRLEEHTGKENGSFKPSAHVCYAHLGWAWPLLRRARDGPEDQVIAGPPRRVRSAVAGSRPNRSLEPGPL